MPIGADCYVGSCGPSYDDPSQTDDGSYHEGEDPDHHTSGGGGTSGASGSSTGGADYMEPAPRRFAYEQKEVGMDGSPEY